MYTENILLYVYIYIQFLQVLLVVVSATIKITKMRADLVIGAQTGTSERVTSCTMPQYDEF